MLLAVMAEPRTLARDGLRRFNAVFEEAAEGISLLVRSTLILGDRAHTGDHIACRQDGIRLTVFLVFAREELAVAYRGP